MRMSLVLATALLLFGSVWGAGAASRQTPAASQARGAPLANSQANGRTRLAQRPVFSVRVPPWPAARVSALAQGTGAGFNAGGARLALYTSALEARQAGVGPGAVASPQPVSRAAAAGSAGAIVPEAADPTTLMVGKTANGSDWTINLSWSGGTSPYTVSYCTEPSFQRGAQSLAQGVASSSMNTAANSSATLEC